MGATLYKRIVVCTGNVPVYGGGGRMVKRQREIGIVLKHESNGNEWLELRLHGDVVNPVLYQQLKAHAIPEGDSMFIATLADVPRKTREPTVGEDPSFAKATEGDAAASGGENE